MNLKCSSFTLSLSRILGILPYSPNHCYGVMLTVYSITYCSVHLVAMIVANYDYVREGKRRQDDWIINPFNLMIYLSQVAFQTVALVVHMFMVFLKRRDLSAIFQNMKDTSVGTSLPMKATGIFTLTGIFCLSGCYMAWLLDDQLHNFGKMPWYAFVCPMYGDIVCLMIAMQFSAMVSVFQCGFAHLTSVLKKKGLRSARELVVVHSHLIRRSQAANKFYALQLVAIMSLATLNYVGWAYYALQSILQSDPNYVLGVTQGVMAFYQIGIVTWLCRCCDETTRNADSFTTQLFHMTKESHVVEDEESIILYVNMKQTIYFNACGFFSLQYPLVGSILSKATTYIVILIQFGMNKPS